MTPNVAVNYLAIVVGMILAFAIGAIWYSPPLFGKQYAASHGMTVAQMRPAPPGFLIAALSGLLNSWVLAVLSLNLGGKSVTDGVMLGSWCGSASSRAPWRAIPSSARGRGPSGPSTRGTRWSCRSSSARS